jgi:hypothetical protein
VASDVERREPAFGGRLETVASRALGPAAWRGSDQLLHALALDVSAEVARRDPAALLPWGGALLPWAAAIVLATLAAATAGRSNWLALPTLLRRYLTPVADVRPVTTTRLSVRPGNTAVAEGRTLGVRVLARGLPGESSPVLHVRGIGASSAASSSSSAWVEQAMSPTAEGTFEARVHQVDHDLEYYVSGGDAASERFLVTVLHKPAVQRFHVRYTYPPYTGLPPRETQSVSGEIEAPAGTEVSLRIEATEPLDAATITIGSQGIAMTRVPLLPASVMAARFVVRESNAYTIQLRSARGVSGAFYGGVIRATRDRPPIVRWREASGPAGARTAGARQAVVMEYQAVDDFGFARLEAEVSITRTGGGQAERRTIALPVAHPRAKQERGTVKLDLGALAARPGDVVEVRLRGEDGGGQFDLSEPIRLAVSAEAVKGSTSAPAVASTRASPEASPTTQRSEPSPPLEPAGFEDALRAYFDTLRRGRAGDATTPAP